MPTQVVFRTVAVSADSCTQPFDFCHKRVTIEIGQIFVHLGFLPFLGLE
jgi:hypothetical protein